MSRRLSALRKEVRLLRDQFLPQPFDPLGNYPHRQRVQAQTRAFLVLTHAEFESYFEEWAREIANAAESVWKRSRRVAAPLAVLVSSISEGIKIPDKRLSTTRDCQQLFVEMVTELFPTYYKRINDNHGIKEANIFSLFLPLGIPFSAFGSTLLPNLDGLGASRGHHAHRSARTVVNVLDPETEFKKVEQLISDLSSFEAWLVGFRKKIR